MHKYHLSTGRVERELTKKKTTRHETLRRRDPALGIAIVLAGCVLSFFLVGFLLIPIGLRLIPRGT